MATGKRNYDKANWEIKNKDVEHEGIKYITVYESGEMEEVRNRIRNIKISDN
jgi:hypothetical protein